MPIPDFQRLMLPLLKFLEDGQEHSMKEALAYLAGKLNLSETELQEPLPSRNQTVFYNRAT